MVFSWRISRKISVVLWAGKKWHGKGLAGDRKGLVGHWEYLGLYLKINRKPIRVFKGKEEMLSEWVG